MKHLILKKALLPFVLLAMVVTSIAQQPTKDSITKAILKARIPFQLINGSIVVSARLNNNSRPLKLLFDTGADGMAIKKSIADSLGLIVTREQNTSVVGSKMVVQISSGNTLHLDTLSLTNNSIALFEDVGKGLDGILGITLARRFITRVDFDKKVIELFSFGKYDFGKDGVAIPAKLSGGVPVIQANVKVGEKEVDGSFIFDTGANYYLIGFGPYVKKNLLLTSGFVPYFGGSTVSLGHASAAYTGNFEKLAVGQLQLQNFPGVLQAFQPGSENWAGEAAGSFGIKASRRYNFTINLPQQVIHFAPNINNSLPYDFVLNGVYFSFDSNTKLVVESVMNDKVKEKLQESDVVVAVNGVKVEQMVKAPVKMKALLTGANNRYVVEVEREGKLETVQL